MVPTSSRSGPVIRCVHGRIAFNDPAVREAYVEARRQPDLTSVCAQLVQHHRRFRREKR
jgi:hypothetical protein